MFIKIPASNKSLSSRKLILGAATNDALYTTSFRSKGKIFLSPSYARWIGMIRRVYSEKSRKHNKSYAYCSVCSEWLLFSNFDKWYETNNIKGYELDKDLKTPGNKIYSPDTCLFIPKRLNTFLSNFTPATRVLSVGVSFHKASGKYESQLRIDGTKTHLGLFESADLANFAYKLAKNEEINRKAKQYPEFAKYLIQHLHDLAGCNNNE